MPPIRPEDAHEADRPIPDEVFEVVNAMIIENLAGRYASFLLSDFVKRLSKAMSVTPTKIESNWLDFEPHYRRVGWKCYCDSPGYNESYSAVYKFEKPSGPDPLR